MKLTVDVSCDRFVNAVSQLAQENSFDPPGWARKIRPMLRFVLFKRKWFKNPKITGYFHGQAQCRRYFYRELSLSWFCFGLFLTWPFDQLWLANIERDVILSSAVSKLFPVFQLPGGAKVDVVLDRDKYNTNITKTCFWGSETRLKFFFYYSVTVGNPRKYYTLYITTWEIFCNLICSEQWYFSLI